MKLQELINDFTMKDYTYLDKVGYFRKITHSQDETKTILLLYTENTYSDILYYLYQYDIDLLKDCILVIVSFNEQEAKTIQKYNKIKNRRKYSPLGSEVDIMFKGNNEVLTNNIDDDSIIINIYDKILENR